MNVIILLQEGFIMKKIIGLFTLMFIASTSFAAGSQDKDYATGEFEMGSCCKNLKIDHVIFAIVDKDPMESYKDAIEPTTDTKAPRYVHIQHAWSRIFDSVTGNQVWSLDDGAPFRTRTNVYDGKRWLVTRAVGTSEENICWSIPINFKKGKTVKIILNEENRVSNKKLEKIFDKAVGSNKAKRP
jgi:hypothetical protein